MPDVRPARLVLLISVALSAALAAPTPANAASFERIAGSDRYATAAAVSKSVFPESAATVFVATGSGFADALAGGPAAVAAGAPMLLVTKDGVPASTRDEITRLRPASIVILGGPGAVSAAVEEQLKTLASSVTRIQGANRYETAANTSKSRFGTGVAVAYVAGGAGFADALAGGPAAAQLAGPVLLTEKTQLSPATRAELQRLTPTTIVVLGGLAAVSAEVETQLRSLASSVRRDASYDRYSSAVAVSKQAFPTTPVSSVYLSTGLAFPDALAAGAAAGKQRVPLLLTTPNCIPISVNAELNRLQPAKIIILGGPSAVSRSVESGTVCPEANPSRLGTDRQQVASQAPFAKRWYEEGQSIAGTRFADAVWLGADAHEEAAYWIDYDLGRDYGAFRTAVGVGDNSEATDVPVEFRVYGDGALLKSGKLNYGQIEHWDVNVVGVLRLRLEVQAAPAKDTNEFVYRVFGAPRVLK